MTEDEAYLWELSQYQQHFNNGHKEDALHSLTLRIMREMDGEDRQYMAIFCRSQMLYQLGRYRESIDDVDRVLTRWPSMPEAHEMRARSYERSDLLERALQDWNNSINFRRGQISSLPPSEETERLNGLLCEALCERAALNSKLGDHEKVLRDVNLVLQMGRNGSSVNGKALKLRSEAYNQLGRSEDAVSDLSDVFASLKPLRASVTKEDDLLAVCFRRRRLLVCSLFIRLSNGSMTEANWVRIQSNTFRNWSNIRLKNRNLEIKDLRTDLRDGVLLINLAEVLTQETMPKHTAKPKMRSQYLDNMNICLTFFRKHDLKLVNIDIVDGNHKIILGLLWTIILKYQIASSPAEGESKGARKDLLEWCQKTGDSTIGNFGADWHSGKAILSIIEGMSPGHLPPNHEQMTPLERAQWASSFAEKELHIPPILSPEDFIDDNVDEQSVMTYLALFKAYDPNVIAAEKAKEEERERNAREEAARKEKEAAEKSAREEEERLAAERAAKLEADKAASGTSAPRSEVEVAAGSIDIQARDHSGNRITHGNDPFEVYFTRTVSVSETHTESHTFEQDTLSHTFYWTQPGDNARVGGAYNNWQLVPMERDSTGRWTLTVHGLKPRTLYRFKYNIDGEWKVDPEQPVDETELVDGRPVKNNAIGLGNAPEGHRTETVETTEKKPLTTQVKVKDHGDGTYSAQYEENVEEPIISVKLHGEEVGGGPFKPRDDLPHHTTSSAHVTDNTVHVQARTPRGNPANTDGHRFTAQVAQSGKSEEIPLTPRENGNLEGNFAIPDPSRESEVRILLAGKPIHTHHVPAQKPQADPGSSTFVVDHNSVTVHSLSRDGRPAESHGNFTAKVTQAGRETSVPLNHDGDAVYRGHLQLDPSEDAQVQVYHADQLVRTHNLNASQPKATDGSISAEANHSGVSVQAKTKDGKPAVHSEEHLTAVLENNGEETRIPLRSTGGGNYHGNYNVPEVEDFSVKILHEGRPVKQIDVEATKVEASQDHTDTSVDGGKVNVHAKGKKGRPAPESNFSAEFVQGEKVHPITLKHEGEGKFGGEFEGDDTKDGKVNIYHDGKLFKSHDVAATRQPEPVREPEPAKQPEPEAVRQPEPEPAKQPETEPAKQPEPETVRQIEPEPVKEEPKKAHPTQSQVFVEENNSIRVVARDAQGSGVMEQQTFTARCRSNDGTHTDVPLTFNQDGTYAGNFVPFAEGATVVEILLNDDVIKSHTITPPPAPTPVLVPDIVVAPAVIVPEISVTETKTESTSSYKADSKVNSQNSFSVRPALPRTSSFAASSYGDQYSKYQVDNVKQRLPFTLYVYYPEGKIESFTVAGGKAGELDSPVVWTSETSSLIAPKLQRMVPTTTNQILLYNHKTGLTSSLPVVPGRRQIAPQTHTVKETAYRRWKHIVPIDVDGSPHVIYHDKDGETQLRRLNKTDFEVVAKSRWSDGYERIVPVEIEGRSALLLYDNHRRKADIGYVDKDCKLQVINTINNVDKKWKHIVALTPGYVLFHQKKTGQGSIFKIDADTLVEVHQIKGEKRTFTQCEFIAQNRQVVLFDAKTGTAQFYDWSIDEKKLTPAFSVSGWKGAKYVAVGY
ncbi:filamin-B-like [Planoprotostelium fungivorum]|uniref:Filamin-B-like n=1 Tax=Planoprotostelium fungivorum TaxID=1890364 RepID=A0A2P6NNI5_9EUKA|nr:filamin-B-like [Planoprotostelium fungivorum]